VRAGSMSLPRFGGQKRPAERALCWFRRARSSFKTVHNARLEWRNLRAFAKP
jgi:hypothetical protein